MPLLCMLAIKGQFPLMDGTWTYKRHMSNQDIEQLGQFIQIDFTQKATDASHTRIIFQLHALAKFLDKIGMLFEIAICIGNHCAELEHAKTPATQPDHFPTIEYTASITEFNTQSNDQKYRHQKYHAN